mmetsp:Transcript_16200/g.40750  ORF Transcript_16200/g.40750 Transcript_16200/m.40750 type:complete len:222 (+) Transcript_16200:969-1634(+)
MRRRTSTAAPPTILRRMTPTAMPTSAGAGSTRAGPYRQPETRTMAFLATTLPSRCANPRRTSPPRSTTCFKTRARERTTQAMIAYFVQERGVRMIKREDTYTCPECIIQRTPAPYCKRPSMSALPEWDVTPRCSAWPERWLAAEALGLEMARRDALTFQRELRHTARQTQSAVGRSRSALQPGTRQIKINGDTHDISAGLLHRKGRIKCQRRAQKEGRRHR